MGRIYSIIDQHVKIMYFRFPVKVHSKMHRHMKKILITFFTFLILVSCNHYRFEKLIMEADTAYDQGDYKKEIALLSEALEIKPDYLFGLNNRAWSNLAIGDTCSAMNDFNTIIERDSSCSSGYYGRGWLRAKLKEYKLALVDFNKALQILGDGPLILTNVSNNFLDENIKKPTANYNDLYFWKGFVQYYLKNYKSSFECLSYGINNDNSYLADSYYYRAFIYYNTGQKEKGCKDLENAMKFGLKEAYGDYKRMCK